MLDILNSLWSQCSGMHPLWAVSGSIVLYVLRDRGYLRWPGSAEADAKAEAIAQAAAKLKADTEKPLRDRLRAKVAARFDELVEDGLDPDDAYKFLLNQARGDTRELIPMGTVVK